MEGQEIDTLIARMTEQLRTRIAVRPNAKPLMVGIHTGGVWIAKHLHQALALTDPLGSLDITFYRDDFTRVGLNPQVKPSQLPVAVDGRHIILVDDVLHTGRTIRAAMNELFDYGRPAAVTLACLVDRTGRELPIQPDVVGLHMELQPGEHVKLSGPDPLSLTVQKTA